MKFALLDPLRGLAALWVFTFHYPFGPWLQARFPLLAALFHLGYLGVPMFFVISGYCITGSARSSLRRDEAPMPFLYRRARRIYPTFWFSIIFAVGMPFWLEVVSSLHTGHYVPPAATVNNGFMQYTALDWVSIATLTRVFAHVPGAVNLQYKFTSLNAVYWTLALEAQFYVAVALALHFRSRFYVSLAALTLVAIPVHFMPNALTSGIFLPYWPMFAVGVLVYWLLERGVRIAAPLGKYAMPASALAALAGMAVFVGYVSLRGAVGEFIVAVAFGSWLLVAHPLDGVFNKASERKEYRLRDVPLRLFLALGSMSYSLYLMHPKLFPVFMQLMNQVWRAPSMVRDVAVIALSCVASYGFYWVCERPFATSSPRRRVLTPSHGAALPAPVWAMTTARMPTLTAPVQQD